MRYLPGKATCFIASLLMVTCGYAEEGDLAQVGKPRNNTQASSHKRPALPELCPAYNGSASLRLARSYDVWADASFIYWQPSGENLELGVADHGTTTIFPVRGDVVNMDFDFKPGFQVGAGMLFGCDDWDVYAQYTYLRSEDSVSSNGYTPGQIRSFWVHPAILLDESAPPYVSGKGTWDLNLDFVDAVVGRWYYSGKKLTMHPFGGLRAAFIRQRYTTDFRVADSPVTATVDHNNSWGIGPRFGFESNWLVGQGIRVYGQGASDILYTQYEIGSKQQGIDGAASITQINVRQNHIGYLRAHLDMELGVGWGMNLDCDRWHIDLSAGYGFQVFFGQIMFRRWLEDWDVVKSLIPSGDLYIQGLTARAKLDF